MAFTQLVFFFLLAQNNEFILPSIQKIKRFSNLVWRCLLQETVVLFERENITKSELKFNKAQTVTLLLGLFVYARYA